MGNASSHTYIGAAPPPAADARVILQHDLPKAIYIEQLANGKFIKSYKCRVDGVMVVVKVYIKRDPTEDLGPVESCLSRMAVALDTRSCPNVLPYQRWLQSSVRASQHRGAGTPAYLLRQHLLGTLRDRLSTRPFLTDIEKRWLVYLLLRAAAQCHRKGVCHGDIKSENVLVTSGNWLLLTDFAPFKPTFLPDDHPADANYYFSSGEQGRCYLAPERFYSAQQANETSAGATGGAADKGGALPAAATGITPGGGGVGGGGGLDGLEASEIRPRPSSNQSGSSSTPTAAMKSDRISMAPSGGIGSDGDGHSADDTQQSQQPQQHAPGSSSRDEAKRLLGSGAGVRSGGVEACVGGGLLESMDVFSLGCVIAEIFLGGDPLLDLPGLLRYRISGDMQVRLKKLEAAGGPVVLRLVEHMLQRDASQRKTVQVFLLFRALVDAEGFKSLKEYIRRMEKPGMLFPTSFGSLLFPLLATMHAGEGSGEGPADAPRSNAKTQGGDNWNKRTAQGAEGFGTGVRGSARDAGRAVRSPDERLALVAQSYGRAMAELAGTPDPEGHALLQEARAGYGADRWIEGNSPAVKEADCKEPDKAKDRVKVGYEEAGRGGSDAREKRYQSTTEGSDLTALMERTRSLIARVEALAAGTPAPSRNADSVPLSTTPSEATPMAEATSGASTDNCTTTTGTSGEQEGVAASGRQENTEGVGEEGSMGLVNGGSGGGRGLVILVQVVCSCLRHLRYPRSRLLGLNLLVAFGRCCDDETRLQRLVPYTMTMLDDPVPVVRATAVRSLRALLGMVTSFPPSDSNTFSLYIFPALQRLPSDSSDLVRIAFAESLASLAETSRRFLETAYAMRRAAAASASTSAPAATMMPAAAVAAAQVSGGSGMTVAGTDKESEDSSGSGGPATRTPDDGTSAAHMPETARGDVGETSDTKDMTPGTGTAGNTGDSDGGGTTPAPGAVLLEGSYDKELSAIRAQISRWFVVLASSGGASGGGGGGPSGSGPGEWSGASGGSSGGGSMDGGGDRGMDGGACASAVVVKRALLADITRLCVFFGFENTLDSILPQLITFLNDRDWSLRAAFCDHIPAVCALAGEAATTRFILPCIENTLVDAREAVVARGLRCLASLAGLGLLPRYALPGQVKAAAPLLQHPGLGVRTSAVELCVRAAEALGSLDTQVFLHPVLRPHFRYALSGSALDEAVLLEALRPPVPRAVFDAAVAEVCEARRTKGRGGISSGMEIASGSSSYHPLVSSSTDQLEDGYSDVILGRDNQVTTLQKSSSREQTQQRNDPQLPPPPGNTSIMPTTIASLDISPGGLQDTRLSASGLEALSLPSKQQAGVGGSLGARREDEVLPGPGMGDVRWASPEEKEALVLLKGYIDTAAQHAANKLAGRGSPGASGGGSGGLSSDFRNGTRSSVYLPEPLSQAVYVPTQKITTLHPGPGVGAVVEASIAASGQARSSGAEKAAEQLGEDNVDVRLTSSVLAADPSLLQSITEFEVLSPSRERMERALSKPRILQSVLENESAYEPEEIMLLGKKEVFSVVDPFGVVCGRPLYSISEKKDSIRVDGSHLPRSFPNGIHTNQLDARRAMALVEQTESDGAEYSYSSVAAAYGYGYGYPTAYPVSATTSAAAMAAAAAGGGVPGSGGGGSEGSSTGMWESSSRGGTVGGTSGGASGVGRGAGTSWAADAAMTMVRRAKALGVPPLPPNLGAVRAPNGVKYSHYLLPSGNVSSSISGNPSGGGVGVPSLSSSSASSATSASTAVAAAQQQYEHGVGGSVGSGAGSGSGGGGGNMGRRFLDWRPRQEVLVAFLKEHGGAVNRLALSQDQAFFVSASSDGTCKVWELRGIDQAVNPQSRATYSQQGGRLLDACMVDNSHSVASASSDGTVHVWRVELAASSAGGYTSNNGGIGGHSSGGGGSGRALSPSRASSHQYGSSAYAGAANGTSSGAARRKQSVLDPTIPTVSSSAYSGGFTVSSGVGGGSGAGGGTGGVGGSGAGGGMGNMRARGGGSGGSLRVCGSSMVRSVSGEDGEIVSVHHFNTELGSPLVYGTRKGVVRSWDLRAREEPWALRAHPELGFLTAIALGTEKTWLVVGSSRGFVMLWDLRFQILARLWRHSCGGPIHKLATCSRLPPPDNATGPHVIVAAGRNEAAIWDLSKGGSCKQCFRVVPSAEGRPPPSRGRNPIMNVLPGPELPVLEEVPLPNHPNAPALSISAQLSALKDLSAGAPQTSRDPAIRALVGRISRSERDSYLITGGSDRCIRYWDFQAASRCYVVSGRESSVGRPSARTLQVPSSFSGARPSNVVLYYDEDPPAPNAPSLKSESLPMEQEKGLAAPRASHDDAILDVKVTELPIKMLLSGSRDGAVKIWR